MIADRPARGGLMTNAHVSFVETVTGSAFSASIGDVSIFDSTSRLIVSVPREIGSGRVSRSRFRSESGDISIRPAIPRSRESSGRFGVFEDFSSLVLST